MGLEHRLGFALRCWQLAHVPVPYFQLAGRPAFKQWWVESAVPVSIPIPVFVSVSCLSCRKMPPPRVWKGPVSVWKPQQLGSKGGRGAWADEGKARGGGGGEKEKEERGKERQRERAQESERRVQTNVRHCEGVGVGRG